MRRTAGGRPAWPVRTGVGLWLLTMLALVAIPWLDWLLRQAGRPGRRRRYHRFCEQGTG